MHACMTMRKHALTALMKFPHHAMMSMTPKENTHGPHTDYMHAHVTTDDVDALTATITHAHHNNA